MARSVRQEAPAGAGAKRAEESRGAGASCGGAAGQLKLQKRVQIGIALQKQVREGIAKVSGAKTAGELQNPRRFVGWLVWCWVVLVVLSACS